MPASNTSALANNKLQLSTATTAALGGAIMAAITNNGQISYIILDTPTPGGKVSVGSPEEGCVGGSASCEKKEGQKSS